jgi:hypothetical protein
MNICDVNFPPLNVDLRERDKRRKRLKDMLRRIRESRGGK